MRMTSRTNDAGAGVPTAWLVELTKAGTGAARWVLGTEEAGIGFYAEDAYPAPGTDADAVPEEDVADWVAESLGVTGVALTPDDRGRWSVAITG